MPTEKEKMLSGAFYNCGDLELQTQWHKAKKLIQEYNNASSLDKELLADILTRLLGSKGKNVWITPPFFCDYGEHISIGNNTEINHNCVMLDCNKITIGNNVLIAPNVQIYAAFHPVKASDRMVQSTDEGGFVFAKTQSAPIVIGDNVWIGGGSIILPGVIIGEGTTIGAGSVVTKSLPAQVLAVGNPCKIVRKL